MARIPDSEIDRIKSETDLIALIQSRGTTLKKQGTNWTGLCPFHDDKETPNLIVTPGKGLFRCMAETGSGGNGVRVQILTEFAVAKKLKVTEVIEAERNAKAERWAEAV